ncbi:hypothetical protein MJL81_31870, partial [Salmonella enterica subsp. enterica serovar Anatum]|nr:hypothetical protein [Salmonella enterica subsp. enterica serovar Anatum]
EVDADTVGQSDGRNYGLIFSGEIRYSVTGKDSPIDSYVLIQAEPPRYCFRRGTPGKSLYGRAGLSLAREYTAGGLFPRA